MLDHSVWEVNHTLSVSSYTYTRVNFYFLRICACTLLVTSELSSCASWRFLCIRSYSAKLVLAKWCYAAKRTFWACGGRVW